MDETLQALFSGAIDRKAPLGKEPKPEEFALALLSLEILGLAGSVPKADGTRSWFATDELDWLASRDYVGF